MADTITITLCDRSFELDREKAEQAYSSKKVINGLNSMFFNILPLKYHWAYNLYKEMKNAHWEPAEHSLQVDIAQWDQLSEPVKRVYKAFLGAFARTQEIFNSDEIYTVRDLLTAPELKLVFGRFVHEENTRNDALVHLHGSLKIDPTECNELTNRSWVTDKKSFIAEKLTPLNRKVDTSITENKQAMVRNIFLANQCMEGTQFYTLWASIFSLGSQNKLPGTAKILSSLLADVTFRLTLFDQLIQEMISENPDIWTQEFQDELVSLMKQSVLLEQDTVADLPLLELGLDAELLSQYIEYLADERLAAFGLQRQFFHAQSPYPWLDEQVHLSSNNTSATITNLNPSFDDDDL